MVFGSLDKGGIVAKGFTFEAPDFQNADDLELNRFHDQIALLLATLGANQRLQVQWYCDSDYRQELLRYREHTAAQRQRVDAALPQRAVSCGTGTP